MSPASAGSGHPSISSTGVDDCCRPGARVDDYPDPLEMVAMALEIAGFAVLLATSGRDAVRLARRYHPAAVVIDIHMPLIDGVEPRADFAEDPDLHGTPVVAHTAQARRHRLAFSSPRRYSMRCALARFLSVRVGPGGISARGTATAHSFTASHAGTRRGSKGSRCRSSIPDKLLTGALVDQARKQCKRPPRRAREASGQTEVWANSGCASCSDSRQVRISRVNRPSLLSNRCTAATARLKAFLDLGA